MGLVDVVHIVQAMDLGVHCAGVGRPNAPGGGGGAGRRCLRDCRGAHHWWRAGAPAAHYVGDVFHRTIQADLPARTCGFAQQCVIALDQADIGVVGLGAGIGKEHVVELGRGDLHQRTGQFHRRLVGTLEKIIVERQFLQLGVDGVLDALLAVSQVATPQARHAIQHLVAIAVIDINVFRPGNDPPTLLAVILQVGERVQVVGLVQLLQAVCICCGVHRHVSWSEQGEVKLGLPSSVMALVRLASFNSVT